VQRTSQGVSWEPFWKLQRAEARAPGRLGRMFHALGAYGSFMSFISSGRQQAYIVLGWAQHSRAVQ